eukprot:scaffold8556_cov286-Pinguiococcus_pyrenoidosus.AAC.19
MATDDPIKTRCDGWLRRIASLSELIGIVIWSIAQAVRCAAQAANSAPSEASKFCAPLHLGRVQQARGLRKLAVTSLQRADQRSEAARAALRARVAHRAFPLASRPSGASDPQPISLLERHRSARSALLVRFLHVLSRV